MIVTPDDVLLHSQHEIKDHLNLPLHLKLDQNRDITSNKQKDSPFKRIVRALQPKVKPAFKVQKARRRRPHPILAITLSKDGYCPITPRLTQSTELAAAENVKKAQRTLEELVPSVY